MLLSFRKLLYVLLFAMCLTFTGIASAKHGHHHGHNRHHGGVNFGLIIGAPAYYGHHGYGSYYDRGFVRCKWIPGHWGNYGYWEPARRVCWRY